MKSKFSKFLVPVAALAMLAFAVYHVVKASQTLPKPSPPAEPSRSAYELTVAGSGIVEPQTENISIGSALPGVVLEVFVPVEKVGQRVKAGDPLFRVDDRALRAQLKYQEAMLEAARAQLSKLEQQPRPEEVPPSEAKVRVAEANVSLQQDLAERGRRLRPTGAMSDEDVSQRLLTLEVARQQLTQSRADLALLKAGAWGPDKAIARAAVAQAEAQIEQTKTDLDRALVRAPIDGDVLQVNVRMGEYVGTPPGQALVVLGNVHKVHVRVDVDEHDVWRFQPGAPAVAHVRGNSQLRYPLTFVRVEPYVIPKKSLTGDNTERVDTRVLQVIYAVNDPNARLYVGQQLDVYAKGASGTTLSTSQER
jgi:multidrug resistance efflux pump